MQRSASKSDTSTPSGPPAKRVRLSNGASTPSFVATPSDRGAPASATAEDQRREDALARAAEKAGETRWVLSLQDPQLGSRSPVMPVRQAGFGVIDAEDDSDEDGEYSQPVRIQFGGGIKKKNAAHDRSGTGVSPTHAQSENDESESESSEPEEYDPTDALIRETEREIKVKARNARNKRQNERSTPLRPALVNDEDMDLGNQAEAEDVSGSNCIDSLLEQGIKAFMTAGCCAMHPYPTFSPFSISMYSSPTIMRIWLSSMKLSWSPLRAAPSLSYKNLAKAK
jgi:hypothetical protein